MAEPNNAESPGREWRPQARRRTGEEGGIEPDPRHGEGPKERNWYIESDPDGTQITISARATPDKLRTSFPVRFLLHQFAVQQIPAV